MKYKYKLVGYKARNIGKVCLLYKGAFSCKLNNGKRHFSLPWNVKIINLQSENEFPIILQGFKGKFKIDHTEVKFDHEIWKSSGELIRRSQLNLQCFGYSDFQKILKINELFYNIDLKNLKAKLDIESSLADKTSQFNADLKNLTEFKIPQSILKTIK
jgi:hypothetical protein